MLGDLRYAWRQLRKSPGFALTAVVTLALGIGATTAIFSIIRGALRLSWPNANRMVAIQNVYPDGAWFSASYPDFMAWRSSAKSYSQLVAEFTKPIVWTPSGAEKSEPRLVSVGLASEGYLHMFGMTPIVGRQFLAAEHQKGAAPVCVLAAGFWRKDFGGDPGVVGKQINLDGKACTIAGVVPEMRPSGNHPVEAWMPLEPSPPWDAHGTNYLFATGVLRHGVTENQALAELQGIQKQIDRQFPDSKHGVALEPLSKVYFGQLRPVMMILLAAVGFILLIVCVNLANMLLARATGRARELAVRRALGASAWRILRQTLAESLFLSLGGAAAGLAVAVGLTHIPIAAWPKGFVPPSSVPVDGVVLGFTTLLGVATGVLFGMIPGLRVLRYGERSALQPGRTVTEGREHGRMRAALVVAEIALSMLLVAGAASMALYFAKLLQVNSGVNPQNALVMTVQLSPQRYPSGAEQRRFYNALESKLAALPGVRAVGGSADTPLAGANQTGDFEYEGQASGTAEHNPFAEMHFVTPGYFAAVEAPIIEGRNFTQQDEPDSQNVVIINRRMAQKLWPGQNPIGKYVKQGNEQETVVGVVGDIRFNGPAEPAGFQIYQSVGQVTPSALSFVVRSAISGGGPLALSDSVRHAVASIDPDQPVSNVTTLETISDEALAGQRTSMLVTGLLGCLALLLASIGVYGVMAYSVSRREREFGIRIALGANRGSIVRLLFSGVSRLVLAGVVLGGVLAWAALAWMESRLGPGGNNVAAVGLAAVLLSAVAGLATVAPARRAMRAEPLEVLRSE
jgi:predicted permease